MTYIPDLRFAAQSLPFPDIGNLVRFPSYDLAYCDAHDPYRDALLQLTEEGAHRNVYLVSEEGQVKWRIADYPQPLPDNIGDIRRSEKPGHATAVTFRGWFLDIDLQDGSVKVFDRTK